MSKQKDKANESQQEKETATSRINVLVTKSFHKEIKQRALDEDITITDLIIKVMKEYLKKKSH